MYSSMLQPYWPFCRYNTLLAILGSLPNLIPVSDPMFPLQRCQKHMPPLPPPPPKKVIPFPLSSLAFSVLEITCLGAISSTKMQLLENRSLFLLYPKPLPQYQAHCSHLINWINPRKSYLKGERGSKVDFSFLINVTYQSIFSR